MHLDPVPGHGSLLHLRRLDCLGSFMEYGKAIGLSYPKARERSHETQTIPILKSEEEEEEKTTCFDPPVLGHGQAV